MVTGQYLELSVWTLQTVPHFTTQYRIPQLYFSERHSYVLFCFYMFSPLKAFHYYSTPIYLLNNCKRYLLTDQIILNTLEWNNFNYYNIVNSKFNIFIWVYVQPLSIQKMQIYNGLVLTTYLMYQSRYNYLNTIHSVIRYTYFYSIKYHVKFYRKIIKYLQPKIFQLLDHNFMQ